MLAAVHRIKTAADVSKEADDDDVSALWNFTLLTQPAKLAFRAQHLTPKPKSPGILSLRTPVHLYGSFRHPDYGLDKGKLFLRAGAAVALALVNPLTALIPLIETGPGKDTDCARLLAPVQAAKQQANATGTAPPKVRQ